MGLPRARSWIEGGHQRLKLSAEKTWAAELISPKSLDSKALDQLNDDMVDLSWRVCRGPDPTYWSEALEGWKTYFEEGGGYAQDYDCLAGARYGNILIHYCGYSVLPLGEDATLIWGHVGLTDPEHQGAGVLAAARDLLVEDFFARMGDFTSPTYV